MPTPGRLAALFLVLLVTIATRPVSAGPLASLTKPPLGDRWFAIFMDNERVGFAHVRIEESPAGYGIYAEGSVKMRVLGFSREASSRENYTVHRNLTLNSFSVEETIDGSTRRVSGDVTGKGVRVTLETAGMKTEKILPVNGAVYPLPVLNIYPFLKGAEAGKSYNLKFLDVEAIRVNGLKITVLGQETLPGGVKSLHMRNDLYPFVDNDVWVDLAGNTVRESVRDGLIVTEAEDAKRAGEFIYEASLAKRDLILDFSLVRTEPPVARPLELKGMTVELAGFPETVPLLEGAGQKAARLPGGKAVFTIESPPSEGPGGTSAPPDTGRYLGKTERIFADHPEIVARAREIVGEEKVPARAAERLTRWVAATVEDTVTDSQSPLETLEKRKGNCQSHARLYASLARAAGIPTSFVSGLVYAEGKGFLYHSWAESYVGYWLPVDPTFGQFPADATHVKLVEGDGADDMAPLAAIVGRIGARIVEEKY